MLKSNFESNLTLKTFWKSKQTGVFWPDSLKFRCWNPKSFKSRLNSVRVPLREFPTKFGLCGRLLTESDKDQTFKRIESGIPRSRRESGNLANNWRHPFLLIKLEFTTYKTIISLFIIFNMNLGSVSFLLNYKIFTKKIRNLKIIFTKFVFINYKRKSSYEALS